jgi:hypothetical protein
MSLALEKVYADLATTDGTLCIAYVETARWRWARHAYAGAEIFRPDGSRETRRATGDPRDWLVAEASNSLEIRFPCETGQFRLRYEPLLDGWQPDQRPAQGLEWSMLTPRAVGRLWWPGEQECRFQGEGYVDRVRITRTLRRIRLTELEWGRVHLSESTLVYSRVLLGTRETWQRAVWWPHPNAAPRVWHGFRITPEEGRLHFRTEPECVQAALILTLSRQLHSGPAIEMAPDPRVRDRAVMWLLAGPLVEDRWLSLGQCASGANPPTGWAVHEVVGRERKRGLTAPLPSTRAT